MTFPSVPVPDDPDGLIAASLLTLQAVDVTARAFMDAPRPELAIGVATAMASLATAEATLALALYEQRKHKPTGFDQHPDDRK